jgi:hypothetical protein
MALPSAIENATSAKSAPRRPDRATRGRQLREIIEHASHYLPAQGPIKVFIHHNTLHAFEHLPFDVGVKAGAKLFGCQPTWPKTAIASVRQYRIGRTICCRLAGRPATMRTRSSAFWERGSTFAWALRYPGVALTTSCAGFSSR